MHKAAGLEGEPRFIRQSRRNRVPIGLEADLGEEPLVMVRIGGAAFDGVDRHGRINPDRSAMPGDSVENKQIELIMSDRWFR